MIPEIGHFCLILALCLAVIQAILSMTGTIKSQPLWVKIGKSAAFGQLFFLISCFFLLTYSFITNDFSVAYVAQNSNSALPWFYRLCASWGAHEGSLLLWVLVLAGWTVSFCLFGSKKIDQLSGLVVSILGFVSIGFLLFLLLTSNPFLRLLPDAPINGRDLNPLLQDPGLIIHPPILYMGYVGFAIAFAFALSALISGKFDANWARQARPWTLVAWSFLTLGITLGSWWAYRVLGWGGWWFWDPVENASFLPWLSGTALFHSLLVVEKRETFKAWAILLAVCTFSLSLIGTFLVRSGILVSVHAFAVDPTRGTFVLYFLAIVIGGSLLLYALRGNKIINSGIFGWWSKETFLLTNNILFTVAMLTVLLGTIYPLIIDGLGLGKLSVGPPYFNTVFVPLMIPVLFLMAFAPAIHWETAKPILIIKRFKYSLLVSILLSISLPVIITRKIHLTLAIGLFLAFWVVLASLQNQIHANKKIMTRRYGMLLAHLGFAVCTIGVILTSAYSDQRDLSMQLKDSTRIGPYLISFNRMEEYRGPNYSAYRGEFIATQGHQIYRLLPELRLFHAQQISLPKAAIHKQLFHDLYISLGEPLQNQAWSMRIYYKPFVRWIWVGGIMMMLGGVVSAWQLRKVKGP